MARIGRFLEESSGPGSDAGAHGITPLSFDENELFGMHKKDRIQTLLYHHVICS